MSQGSLEEEEIIELLSGIENVRLNEDESAVVSIDQTALPGKKSSWNWEMQRHFMMRFLS